ncbi:hypothetical protein ABAC402_16575 [Asticcacaulis sp. AC402]|nr:hypothetical protein ABAC402_16575 [Asticcacaulis sp. AC402]
MGATCLASPLTAFAQDAATVASEDTTEVIILGRGQPRQVQTIKAQKVLDYKVPGASPLKLAEQLPGVYFAGADPFGTYEYAATLYLRGFNQSQLGYTLDGVPLGDMSYSNHNGLHISRAIISENVNTVQLAQGASDVDAASTSNLGGSLRFSGRRAPEAFGADLSLSAGSDDYRRLFARVDTGEIAGSGVALSLSYADSFTHTWKGSGEQQSRQANLRLDRNFGDDHHVAFWLHGSQRRENDYLEQSREQIDRLGYDWNYLAPDFALAERIADVANNRDDTGLGIVTNAAAGTDYPGNIQSPDDSYYQGAGLRDDLIGAITWDGRLNPAVSFSVSAYGHANKGQGPWFTPYVPSPNATDPLATEDNSPLSFRGFSYNFTRAGAIGGLSAELGAHKLSTGLWVEINNSKEAYNYYGLTRGRLNRDSLEFQTNPFFTDDQYSFETKTVKFHVADLWRVSDVLTVQYGFKSQSVVSRSRKLIDENAPVGPGDAGYVAGKISSQDGFLPQAGFVWRVQRDHEVFGAYGESIAAFAAQVNGIIANGDQAIVDDAIAKVKPERSRTTELGWRYKGKQFDTVLAAYAVRFDNRVLAFYADPTSPILVSDTIYRNVGSVRTVGVEAAINYRLDSHWTASASYTYNDSRYDSDVVEDTGAVSVQTRDKVVAGEPSELVKASVNYDDGARFAGLSYALQGSWYYTYENDNPVKGHDLVDVTAGYRFQTGTLKGAEVTVNVSNLFDRRYLSTVAGLVPNDPDGTAQVLFVGAPRSVFITVSKAF